MHCAQARNQIALLVGSDIADSDRIEVEQHLSACQACCQYRGEIAESHAVLQDFAAEDSSNAPTPGLWKQVQPAVKLESLRQTRRFNGWLVGLCVAALVMAMVKISGDLTTGSDPLGSGQSSGYEISVSNEQSQPAPKKTDDESGESVGRQRPVELR